MKVPFNAPQAGTPSYTAAIILTAAAAKAVNYLPFKETSNGVKRKSDGMKVSQTLKCLPTLK